MNSDSASKAAISENELTGLQCPRTWNQAYAFVISNFIIWLALLIALTELSK
jgi:hypothetical protein